MSDRPIQNGASTHGVQLVNYEIAEAINGDNVAAISENAQAVLGRGDASRPLTTSLGALAAAFGPFRLFPAQRLLLCADKAVPLGSRALDLLIALEERSGELASKEELMARVWPNTFVVPANLTVHVAALRRALGRRARWQSLHR